MTTCGAQHHDHVYPAGSKIAFSGAVKPVPAARWKVKIKIKVCQGGAYVDVVKLEVPVDKHTGTFSGSWTAPGAGIYEATARLYVNGVETAKSVGRHFQVL
ncbi:MAG TPA: hypothetical protein VFP55_07090 [Solirubrobacteraceae bacterium]|nr:hypothetical protein [Solirubrobacteraceae bacterium]